MNSSNARTKDEGPRYIVRGLLAEGHVSLLVGTDEEQISIFALSMVAKIEAGEPFLGLPTIRNTAVYARDLIFDWFLERAQSCGVKRSAFVTGHYSERPSGLPALLEHAIRDATDLEARVLVFGIPFWGEFGLDTAARLFQMFRDAADSGLAVLLVCDAAPTRGSNVAVDRVISIGLADHVILVDVCIREEFYFRCHEMRTVGAFAQALPCGVLLSLTEEGFELLGPPSSPTGTVGGSS